jgi:hypothetical protein
VLQGLWFVLWSLAMVAWIVGAIAAIVHLTTRVRPPMWVVVVVVVALFLLPVITVAVYWLVIALVRPGAAITTARSSG